MASVSIYAEGTFEEQVQDLVNYLVRNKPEEERTSGIQPFQESLRAEYKDPAEKKRKVIKQILDKVSGFGEGNDKEIEGFFNLLFAHLLSPHGPDLAHSIPSLLSILESAETERPQIKFLILSNLFNALPATSPYKLSIYNALLRLASTENNLEILNISKPEIEQWFQEWPSSDQEKSTLLQDIVDALNKANQPSEAYEFQLLLARQISPSSLEYQNAAINLIVTSIRTPTNFDFDTLLTINSVVATKDHPLFSLLHIYLNDGLEELRAWTSKHGDILSQHNLDASALERKIRLLSLAALGFKNVGQQVSYETIASTIDIPVNQVERWVIDVIRSNLLSGKLSQRNQTLHITRSTARTFERAEWELLESRLVSWKKSLEGVLDVIATSRKQAGNVTISAPVAKEQQQAQQQTAAGAA